MKSRKLLALITSVVALLALTGCMRMHEDLTLHSDNTVSGSIIMAYDVAVLEMSGKSEQDVDELLAAEGLGDLTGAGDDSASVSDYRDGGYVGFKMEFTELPLEDLASESGISIIREGDEFVVEADYSAIEADLAAVPANMLASMDMRTTITFPGAVIEQRGGEVEGNTVTWVTNFNELGEVYGRAHAIEGAGGGVPVLFIGAGLVLLVLLGTVIFLLVRGRKKPAANLDAAPFAAGPHATGAYGGEPYGAGPYIAAPDGAGHGYDPQLPQSLQAPLSTQPPQPGSNQD